MSKVVLAKVLDADVRLLNLEAFLDKCPEEVINFLNMARSSIFYVATNIYNNPATPEEFEKISEALEILPLSEFLIKINDNKEKAAISKEGNKLTSTIKGENSEIVILQLPELLGIPIKDDSMAPLILGGSSITLELKPIMKVEKFCVCRIKSQMSFFLGLASL